MSNGEAVTNSTAMNPWVTVACIAAICVGVAIIAYVLLRTPKKPAGMGEQPHIDLGAAPEDTPNPEEGTDGENAEAQADAPAPDRESEEKTEGGNA